MTRIRSLGAALLLAVLLLGIPAALLGIGGNPIPSALPSWDQVISTISHPATGSFLIGALLLLGWLGWATFAIAVIIELPAALRGRQARPVRGFGLQQRVAAGLLGAIIISTGATSAMAAPATIQETGTSPAAVVAIQDSTTTSPEAATEHQVPATAAPETAWETHLVEPGQSLWEISEIRLGDGNRWQELATLNYDTPQADGHHLTPEHWLNAGWELRIPGTEHALTQAPETPAPEQPTATATTMVTVESGDTLSGIALEHLGDANRYPELAAASAGIEQPGGYHLTDPNLIDVGWQIAIPGAPVEAPAPAPAPELTEQQELAEEAPIDLPAPSEDVQQPVQAPAIAEVPATVQAPPVALQPSIQPDTASEAPSSSTQTPAEVQTPEESESADSIPVRTAGGIGALLAAGILSLLALRRQRSQRTRPPGHRVARPIEETPASRIEAELRAVADPIGADTVNIALRDLAAWCTSEGHPLPDVRAARLTRDAGELQLFLAEAATLPAPWTGSQDRTVWVLAALDVDEDLLSRTDPLDVPAPWPSLVTLGLDEEDATFLLDLEQVGHLDIRGDSEAAHGTLAALAVELATTPWADDLRVTLVGTLPGLPEVLDTSRVRYVSGLPAVMRELQVRAEQLQASGTTRLDLPEAWTPEILLIGTELDTHTRRQLDDLVARLPRVGIAAVTRDTGSSDWVLELDPRNTTEGILSPTEMRVRPTQITPADYAALLSVLTGAEHLVPGPTWAQTLALTTEPTLEELPEANLELDIAEEPEILMSTIEEDLTHEVLAVDVNHIDVIAHEAPAVVALHVPLVRVLGDVDVVGIDTTAITSTHLTQAIEVIAYLSLHPGASTEKISRDLWPGIEVKASTRKSAISRARKILGTNEAGEPYLLLSDTNPTGSEYGLSPAIRSDWDTFNELRGNDPTTTSLEDLRRALNLVRDTPFSRIREGRTRVRANRYVWADQVSQEMVSSIIDVACETARRALLEGKPKLAAEAAAAGLRAGRDDERIWRYAIRAAVQTGDSDAVDRLVRELTTHLTDLEVDPQPETNDLLDELDHNHVRHAG